MTVSHKLMVGVSTWHLAIVSLAILRLPVLAHARIVLFRAVRAYLHHHTDVLWNEVVFRFNYTDQNHLIRDLKRYCGAPYSSGRLSDSFKPRARPARILVGCQTPTLMSPELMEDTPTHTFGRSNAMELMELKSTSRLNSMSTENNQLNGE